jgi:CRISPR-associated protein Cas10/Cmr2 subtype III-B
MERDHRLALLPADTRIPDHSIWTHMQVTSALAGCVGGDKVWKPAFLKFQLGPVQDFIAAARSIRDLWSGSYLLSWLMAAGLKALSEKVGAGPDAVIFPNLLGQPLFDLHWRKELWERVHIGSKSVWESLAHDDCALLTPNLPNVFLAVVSADRADELGKLVEDAIRKEWAAIAGKVWQFCDGQVVPGEERTNLTADEGALTRQLRQQRFEAQVKRFLSISWQATPWPDTLEEALKLVEGFDSEMPMAKARDLVRAVVDMAEKQMPVEHRDARFYRDAARTKLSNVGLGWSVIVAFTSWSLDAVRQTRSFDAWTAGGWHTGAANNKDSLNGRDEAVAGGTVWQNRCVSLGGAWQARFKKDDWLGAATLIKRLWDLAYLKQEWNLAVQRMPNTRGIAGHDPFAQDTRFNDEDQSVSVDEQAPSEKHFAVLALDGDKIGSWISGEKTPPFASQVADYKDGSGNARGAWEYFTRDSDPDANGSLKDRFSHFLKSGRPLSPSYHLQFSQALGNFALFCARPIVEAFDGHLIYAGGDDVVALLPADTALTCAQALRMAFTGSHELKETLRRSAVDLCQRHEAAPASECQKLAAEGRLLAVAETAKDGRIIAHPGFLVRLDDCQKARDQRHFADGEGRPIPLLVPGPAADCSVGIAIAHFQSPLQDVVRAAQAAEKRAKDTKGLNRSAAAVTLMKRSGEIIEWGCKWDSGGLELLETIQGAMSAEQLSAKFPHRVVELLEPYLTTSTSLVKERESLKPVEGFNAGEVILAELAHALERQCPLKGQNKLELFGAVRSKAQDFIDFIVRLRGQAVPSPAGVATEPLLEAFIGLMQTAAFAHRTRGEVNQNPPPKVTI